MMSVEEYRRGAAAWRKDDLVHFRVAAKLVYHGFDVRNEGITQPGRPVVISVGDRRDISLGRSGKGD